MSHVIILHTVFFPTVWRPGPGGPPAPDHHTHAAFQIVFDVDTPEGGPGSLEGSQSYKVEAMSKVWEPGLVGVLSPGLLYFQVHIHPDNGPRKMASRADTWTTTASTKRGTAGRWALHPHRLLPTPSLWPRPPWPLITGGLGSGQLGQGRVRAHAGMHNVWDQVHIEQVSCRALFPGPPTL